MRYNNNIATVLRLLIVIGAFKLAKMFVWAAKAIGPRPAEGAPVAFHEEAIEALGLDEIQMIDHDTQRTPDKPSWLQTAIDKLSSKKQSTTSTLSPVTAEAVIVEPSPGA